MMRVSEPAKVRPGMRWMLYVAGGLVFLVGIQLFILTDHTDRYFAWTIQPPLTAAFLGAAYWASFLLEWLAARERVWARARIALPAVLIFTTLTLIVTLVHLDRFHLHAPNGPPTIAATWVWIAVYATVPPIMAILLVRQARTPGMDPPRERPLAPWMRALLGLQAVVLLALGVALLVAPLAAGRLWPWTLTALTGRAVGAWFVGLGIASAQTIGENDLARVGPALAGDGLFGVLELIALARYPQHLSGDARTWLYLIFILSFVIVGGYGLAEAWRGRRQGAPVGTVRGQA